MDLFDRPVERQNLLDADIKGYTKKEFDALSRPLSSLSFKKYLFRINRLLMNTVGRLSQGIQVGWKTGFDSGSMLDYVYLNKAHGMTPIGRLLDRIYLDSPGWAGIRQRKVNLERLLTWAIDQLLAKDDEVRIADIATGQGRYVLDVLKTYEDKPVSALLRDYSDVNIEAGRMAAKKMELANVTFEQGDAFDGKLEACLPNKPNIGIVSGLYELFPENAPIKESLKGSVGPLPQGDISSIPTSHGTPNWSLSHASYQATGMENPG